jgi:hypothetical protein
MKYRSAFRRRPFRAHRPVLDEQRTLFQSELGIAARRQQELAAVVELSRALGGGWSEARPWLVPCPDVAPRSDGGPERRERRQHLGDVGLGMRGVDLEADRLVALGHDGEGQPHRQDLPLEQPRHEGADALRVAEE